MRQDKNKIINFISHLSNIRLMTKKYDPKKSLSKQFPNIRTEDQSNLQTVLKELSKEGLHVRLAGSALERTTYYDIDLGAWDKDPGTKSRDAVKSLLEKLGVAEYEQIFIPATYVHGWVRFEYRGTRFDLICTSFPYYLGYLTGN